MNIFTNIKDDNLISKLNDAGYNVDYGKNYFTDNLDFSKYDKFILSPTDLAYITATLTLTESDVHILGHFPYPSNRVLCFNNVDELIKHLLPPERDIKPLLTALAAIIFYKVQADKNGLYSIPYEYINTFSKHIRLNMTTAENSIVCEFLEKRKT